LAAATATERLLQLDSLLWGHQKQGQHQQQPHHQLLYQQRHQQQQQPQLAQAGLRAGRLLLPHALQHQQQGHNLCYTESH
jgi:hypothetical protein